ncbi:two-component sensor histidine kinase [Flavobacterium noncentrifugens]|uniref:histidine kinase n=1 Tax=Flavobacterium noncentrifugens TaxID=1128970 RepID=A0A1G8WTE1_9FLAO|nr:HAMP domain-containing sensor histidine kinase [Flavobacterium noncentrifugens]GEP51047.1 two-component sensor histidine kinase [Flavobacterium noncentrifugens]SDJ81514.1 Signal transduction histidine kinase [Flavobacterium noncentrifugens]
MKIITKTSLFYFAFGIPILIVSGYICFSIATEEIEESNEGVLLNLQQQVVQMIKTRDNASLNLLKKSNEVSIREVSGDAQVSTLFSDTLLLDKRENEYSQGRMLTSIINLGGTKYRIKIWRNTLESNQLIGGIFTSMMAVLILLVLIYIVINFYVSKRLWRPFYTAVDNLQKFQASDKVIPNFVETGINEFEVLNTSLKAMMGSMISDYGRQKRFTENTSHEIHTPLAVIKSKIDLLIQSVNLGENEAQLIVAIDEACSKLIQINRSLLLLTKIENRQFTGKELVSFKKKVNNSLGLFEDHIKNGNIHVFKNFDEDFLTDANPDLCQILVNNLIQNAIRHNHIGGSVIIIINKQGFIIQNTGKSDSLKVAGMYERFNKDSQVQDSVGLGLAIAKEIAETNALFLTYKYDNENHIFSIAKRE